MALQEALNALGGVETNELSSLFWNSMPPEILNRINLMLNLGTAILIITLVYFLTLFGIKIIKFIFGLKEARRLKNIGEILERIEKNISEITEIFKDKADKRKTRKKG